MTRSQSRFQFICLLAHLILRIGKVSIWLIGVFVQIIAKFSYNWDNIKVCKVIFHSTRLSVQVYIAIDEQ